MVTPAIDPALAALGWRPFFMAQLAGVDSARFQPVRVMAVHRGMIAVAGVGIDAMIASHRADSAGEEDRATVGDWLVIDRADPGSWRILDRASLFKRRAPGGDNRLQLVAANVDTLLIVASCNQDFNLARIERYLVLAREAGVRPVVVLTKIDLADQPEQFATAARALQPGLRVELVNARDARDGARLAALCGPGETVALLGSSGVGKSTLVNTMRGDGSIATQAVRDHDGKGRHTTTARSMHRLERGGWLLDTPGMREFQIVEAGAGLADVFDDIATLTLDCRFSNCTHGAEPGCAIRAALDAGTLTHERLDRWRKLTVEDASNSGSLALRRARSGKTGHKDKRNG